MQKAIESHKAKDEISWVLFDIDKHKDLAQMLEIEGVPTIFAVKGGQLVNKVVGAPPGNDGLLNFIDESFKKAEEEN